MRVFYSAPVFVVDPLLAFVSAHEVVEMTHEEHVVDRLRHVGNAAWKSTKTHRKSRSHVLHVMPVSFRHVQHLAMVERSNQAFSMLQRWPFLEIWVVEVDILARNQRMRNLIEIFRLIRSKQNTLLGSVKVKMQDVRIVDVEVHEHSRIRASKEKHRKLFHQPKSDIR